MKGWTLKKWMMPPINAPKAAPISSMRGITTNGTQPDVLHQMRRDHTRQRDDGADGQVDAA